MKITTRCLFLLCVFVMIRAEAVDYRNLLIGKEKKETAGIIGSNLYAEVAFLNPSVHRSAFKKDEFDLYMPSRDMNNRLTYDQTKAKIRLFFKPALRAASMGGRRTYLVGAGHWKLEQLKDGVKISRLWRRNSNRILSEVICRMADKKAEIVIEAVLTNQGRGPCQVDFSPQFAFMRDNELNLLIPRQQSDMIDGKQVDFFYGEKIRLDNTKGRKYFWRRSAKDDMTGFVDYVARERIPFFNNKIPPVDMFGFVQLTGGSNLVWDLKQPAGSDVKINYIEFGWENDLGDAIASWNVKLNRGETKRFKFRLITVKGLSRFDAVSDDMIVGYGVDKDRLRIEMVPLVPLGISSLKGEVVSAADKQVLIQQDSQLAEMRPFSPGRMEWRSTAMFKRGDSYPIKISLLTPEGKLLLKSDGVIVP